MHLALGRLQLSLVLVKRERASRYVTPAPADDPLERAYRRSQTLQLVETNCHQWQARRLVPAAPTGPSYTRETLPDAPYWQSR